MKNISIIMRSHNDINFIEETLKILHRQSIKEFELINLDNSSTDGTLEIIKKYNKLGEIINIKTDEYIPGVVLNKAVKRARGEIIVLLNADATPEGEKWLESLVAGLREEEKVVAVYGRQIARKNANLLVRIDCERAYPAKGENPKISELLFSFVSAAFYKKIAEQCRFYEKGYSEDIEWCTRLIGKGYRHEYASESLVYHSHDFTLKELLKRHYILGAALPYYEKRKKIILLLILFKRCIANILRDIKKCIKVMDLRALAYSPVYRVTIFVGYGLGMVKDITPKR